MKASSWDKLPFRAVATFDIYWQAGYGPVTQEIDLLEKWLVEAAEEVPWYLHTAREADGTSNRAEVKIVFQEKRLDSNKNGGSLRSQLIFEYDLTLGPRQFQAFGTKIADLETLFKKRMGERQQAIVVGITFASVMAQELLI